MTPASSPAALRRSVRLALLTAVAVSLGYTLMTLPIELVTFTVVLAGVLCGPRGGLAVGLMTQFIYGGFNPLGSAFGMPWLFAAQLLGMGTAGLLGGILAPFLRRPGWSASLLASLLGLLITAFSQALLSLSFAVVSENPGVFWTWLLTGSVFTVGYLAWNAMVFALLPSLSRRLQGSFMDEDLV
ncbi:MAG: ECF transporter S component [Candidatus Delongbacteria bacterium]|nr:ECF transporter S component [Candidatus Cloacimonadota bacterium]MCB9473009.1 ECF transporter S component [Candidatus Delongbacteria bacterium]